MGGPCAPSTDRSARVSAPQTGAATCTRSRQSSPDAHPLGSVLGVAVRQVPAAADARDQDRTARALLPWRRARRRRLDRCGQWRPSPGAILRSAGEHVGGITMNEGNRDTSTLRAEVAERTIERAVFGGEHGRRAFLKAVGATTATAALASVFPMAAAKAIAQDKPGPPEKRDLKIGFIPITCATPIIMAEPMGFYKKQGLNVQVLKASSWAMIRDISINGETDATHMLSPMPLAITLGVGSQSVPYVMPAVENINGQAITLATKHKGVKTAAEMKGCKFGVPFDYSMHNFLLRYFLAEGGVDPDRDVQIRAVPPPEMVANLRANNLDGYLAPDPFNQRAVFEEVGFIFMLSKD